MARSGDYDPSPLTTGTYLNVQEAETIAANPRALRNPKALAHFLQRVHVTMVGMTNQIQQMHRDIQEARYVRERAGRPSTLSPIEAINYLTPEQVAPLVDGYVREKLAALEHSKTTAERAGREATRELNRVRFAVTSLLEDPDMTPDLRQKLVELLRSFDQTAQTGPSSPAGAGQPTAPDVDATTGAGHGAQPSVAAVGPAGGLDALFD